MSTVSLFTCLGFFFFFPEEYKRKQDWKVIPVVAFTCQNIAFVLLVSWKNNSKWSEEMIVIIFYKIGYLFIYEKWKSVRRGWLQAPQVGTTAVK